MTGYQTPQSFTEEEIADIKEILFHFDTHSAELFSQQITQIQDREKVILIKKALGNAKSLYNLIRLFGHFDLLDKIDFKKLGQLYRETENHLALLNTQEALKNNIDNTNLLKDKYNSDPKYARVHKRLVEKGDLTQKEGQIFEALRNVKQNADIQVLQNTRLLENESYLALK